MSATLIKHPIEKYTQQVHEHTYTDTMWIIHFDPQNSDTSAMTRWDAHSKCRTKTNYWKTCATMVTHKPVTIKDLIRWFKWQRCQKPYSKFLLPTTFSTYRLTFSQHCHLHLHQWILSMYWILYTVGEIGCVVLQEHQVIVHIQHCSERCCLNRWPWSIACQALSGTAKNNNQCTLSE